MNVLIRLWGVLTPFRSRFRNLALWILCFQLMDLVPPFFFRAIIDHLGRLDEPPGALLFGTMTIGPHAPITWSLIFLGAWLASQMINAAVDRIVDYQRIKIMSEVDAHLHDRAHRKFMELDLGFHEREQTGKKVSSLLRGTNRIGDFISILAFEITPTSFQILLATGVLLWQNVLLGGFFLFFASLFILVLRLRTRKTAPLRKQRHDAYEDGDASLTQAVVNVRTVQTCAQEEGENRRHQSIWNLARSIAEQEFRTFHRYGFVQSNIINLGRATVFLYSLLMFSRGEITMGSLLLFLNFSERALFSLWRFKRLSEDVSDAVESIDRLCGLLATPPTILDPPSARSVSHAAGELTFSNVSFAYNGTGPTIHQMNFTVQPGEILALVGPSGGGKSTIVKLLLRHVDPQEGEIKLDGQPLHTLERASFRRLFGVVHQQVELFNSSIRENVCYAKPEASDDEIWEALRIAQLEPFVRELPHGLSTIVGERGLTLSGGQCQRLGIARAILGHPAILVFDEATSHLDSYSEHLIQEALDEIMADRTTILIAHRLSTIQKADRILVIENGQIAEEGTHDQLMQCENGIYRMLQDLQHQGEIRA